MLPCFTHCFTLALWMIVAAWPTQWSEQSWSQSQWLSLAVCECHLGQEFDTVCACVFTIWNLTSFLSSLKSALKKKNKKKIWNLILGIFESNPYVGLLMQQTFSFSPCILARDRKMPVTTVSAASYRGHKRSVNQLPEREENKGDLRVSVLLAADQQLGIDIL